MTENEVASVIVDASKKVFSALGPGLLESVYEECLCYELDKRGIFFQRQKALPVYYENIKLDNGYRLDILVENKVVVELKSVETMINLYTAQLLTYLKLTGCKLGLLINFNVPYMGAGIKRIINGNLNENSPQEH